ncbi:putative disease resistance protein RGA4 isoform X1 [Lolium rigidum]|uniref:putative disease resistance protein RGA4 isoform X1 n=2 Tax=Lolium rigidum TaxID=89674 RepID=UPI001F5CBC45|nr:putative disease resistance protein RGA4 isoform X1 [Lolium rigidum]XP_047081968.1 putative disease resistance protein RGA4 isoform X1 [Lolium rigidum]XP_047081969.1 putative disease resistance protein RGA4 isoform X1 [Lolium rigidum]XP_047081970.1 putative disease resistance protein RGA4 isoform X1 [Lolium rigidum]XP_047081971.1 putative disease resistance protein RGA4 isoform X1 [Lolium rigidum]XP_047081972.1 putative disease resistance protein RGA4 isoform X1 [Lolium rigidum]XP_04708197
MAEMVVSMAIGPLVSMLRDKASNYLLDQYNVMEGMEEQHKILKRKLPAILDIITYAEEQATAHMEGAKAWLQELKTVAYEANEVFDEFKYEALRREARSNGHYRKLGFDVIKLFPTHNRVEFRRKMGIKLCRILRDIEALIADMQAFGFKYQPQPQPSVSKQWRQTDYVIIDPREIAMRSRDREKKNIVDILLGQASNPDLVVVPIVGIGGIGKTTLAQLIYNEPQVQKHFQLLLWICVSDTFDVNSLAKSIVEASPKKSDDIYKPPLDRLQKLVSGQRYILVMDDVWNRDVYKWERLKGSLQHGGSGSVVLTTTRNKQVADIMTPDKVCNLDVLEDRFIKEIIEAKAFSSKKEKPDVLVKMVDEIVKRCSGSPLAATALGSVLRTKTSVEEWKAISSRSSICNEETGILPILKLSYNDLPSHVKQCFALCAVFPKDYTIDVAKLIQLWIANGFIPEHKEDSLETTGKHIFNDLASRSFFLDIEESKDYRGLYSRKTCRIHDMMHDIAMSVMEEECVVANIKPTETNWLPDSARHLFLSCEETEGILNGSMKKRSPAIQTLLCNMYMKTPLQHLSKYSSLHALKLCIEAESFLPKAKYLHHLRYLDLSNSNIKALPEDITILYNLKMLDLSYCSHLHRLPRQMKYMTSLRHLYTHGCPKLKSMPPELGKLTKLQTLTCFVAAVTRHDCSDVAELEQLNLGGQLELCQVENVIEAESKVTKLGNQKDLKELVLTWTSVRDSEVLRNFEPHDGLRVLRIYSYGGKCMGMLQNMVEIHLFSCERLQVLFRCGTSFTFPRLKELTLDHLFDFERWWEVNERQEGQTIFPVLEKLFIRYCGKLVALHEAPLEPCSGFGYRLLHPVFPALKVLEMKELESFQRWHAVVKGEQILFPQLEELSIHKCPKLIDLPKAPKLSMLEIEDVQPEIFHWVDIYLSSLTKLILKLGITETTSETVYTLIEPVDMKEKWNQESNITVMKLRCCNSFFGSGALEPWDYFVHLKDLEIDRCGVLVHWPEKVFESLVSLRSLIVRSCKNLSGYAQARLQPSASQRSHHLRGLDSLEIYDCASLVEMFNIPKFLKEMTIGKCHKLESIFGRQQGMPELVHGPSCSEAIPPTVLSELSSSPMNHFCPYLESLRLVRCDSLSSGVLHLPPSLKTILIGRCSNIRILSCQLDELPKPRVTASLNVPKPSAEAREHSLPPCLVDLYISDMSMLGGILCLPTSVKYLQIEGSGFTSLESLSGSLVNVGLIGCSTLASIPKEYGSLERLCIKDCPAIKKLPRCLRQQLDNIDVKYLDAHLEVMALKPKTWKEIPRLVRERRNAGTPKPLPLWLD